MRVLVTGHKGYIGAVLVAVLKEYGHELTGLDSDLYRGCTYGAADPPELPSRGRDVRDVKAPQLCGLDAIIHLAALSNDPLGLLNPDLTQEINFSASVHLAGAAKAAGVKRFLYASSCSIYGATGEDWVDERATFRPVTPYGVSKMKSEAALMALADETFSPVFLRCATAYGFSPRLRFDLVLNNLVAWAHTTGRVFLKSDGAAWRPIVHVEDIAAAYLRLLEAPRELVHNEAFNVGSTQENYRVRDLAGIVRDTLPGTEIEYAQGAAADQRCYRVRCDKIRERLDLEPTWDARRGAGQLRSAFENGALSPNDFEGPRYSRVERVRQLLAQGELDDNLRWAKATVDTHEAGIALINQ